MMVAAPISRIPRFLGTCELLLGFVLSRETKKNWNTKKHPFFSVSPSEKFLVDLRFFDWFKHYPKILKRGD